MAASTKCRIPAMLVPYLERYLDHWRPALLVGAADSDRLWLSWRGYPLDYLDVHRTSAP